MPYIKKENRRKFEQFKLHLLSLTVDNAGQLNYVITKIILGYLHKRKDIHYQDYNEVMGVLECAKQELYRRSIAHYEDKKIKENGDV